MSRWYRAYEGTVTDAKIGEAALVAGCSRSVAIASWHCILESCAAAQNGGKFDTTPRRVAVILGEQPSTIASVFDAFAELGMICDGAVTAWKQRQFESDTSTERSRKYRERQRNGDATLQQRDATPPYTDTETEEDTTSAAPLALDGGSASKPCLAKPPKPAVEADPEGFQDFWDAYPKRDGSPDRKGAVKAFRTALKRASLETILDGTEHFCAAMKARGKAGTEFVPQARTWLNGDRWNERYDAATAADSRQAQNLAILEKYRA